MSLLEMLQNRHSIRKYTDADISDQDLQTILQAGLLSASGRAARPNCPRFLSIRFIMKNTKDYSFITSI